MTDLRDRLASGLADRYTLGRELGQGGMATVYLAHDLRHDRDVALKVLRPEISAAMGADRFLREIKLAAGLTHAHILPVFDSGEAGGLLYYVMPSMEGRSLSPPSWRVKCRAPLGQRTTAATISSAEAAVASTHGRRRGSKTA